jgi:hydantoinase/carbamoylase family amidase
VKASAIDASIRAVLEDLAELSQISAAGSGVNRLAFTEHDADGREWFQARCDRLGLRFVCDPVGNCFGWPRQSERPPVLLGSHLDSVFDAGRFDGTTGVVVGFEVARRLLASDPQFPIAVVSFACEESTRFGMGTVGSRYLLGELTPDALERLRDRDGHTLQSLLGAAGLGTGTPLEVGDQFISCFIEVHVDQGPWLTRIGATLGLVTFITGVRRLRLHWQGEASHSGAQSHAGRKDAFLGAADFTLRADALWTEIDATDTHTFAITVGQVHVLPNSPNTVPGEVQMIVDVRSADSTRLELAVREVTDLARQVASEHGLGLTTDVVGDSPPVAMDELLRADLAKAAERLAVPMPDIVSLSGHDAMVIGRRFPAAMLLVANPSGLSHSPDEAIDEMGLSQAVEVLVSALPDLAEAISLD